ncbi:MAG: sensor domain-containing diguanylate cyclase [Erysipelotrichaceae bacterium]|nr:sensor domain-containing diguanylate cyclase [Erysipelotrichaceae bacterium]
MNYQELVDTISSPCCVMSVKRDDEGKCGDINIICSNSPYRQIMGPSYYDGMIYHELVPKDTNFEDFCFECVYEKKRMHAYVETKALNAWTEEQIFPLEGGDEHIGYCLFFFEFTDTADPSRMAEVSANTAASVIRCCMRLMGADDFKAGMKEVLEEIRRISDAFSCRVIILESEKEVTAFCEAVDETRNDNLMHNLHLSYDVVRTWEDVIGVSNCVILQNEHDFEEMDKIDPIWVKNLRENNVKSLVLIPLRRGKKVVGYLYVANYDTDRTVEVKELVELMSFILGSEIFNYRLLDELETISRTDVLTGSNNRYAMKKRVEKLFEAKKYPFGLTVMDLNGLKEINDVEGHDVGDDFLISCSNIMKEIFGEDNIYRIGGDEFIAVNEDIEKETFDRMVATMRKITENDQLVSVSVGSYWIEKETFLNDAIRYADEDMYRDKKGYYQRHPEKNRRNVK